MKTFYNNDDRYGEAGPFEAENREELVAEMEPTFKTWAEELWDKTNTETRNGMDYDAFIADAIETMRDEFSNALEEVCDDSRKS